MKSKQNFFFRQQEQAAKQKEKQQAQQVVQSRISALQAEQTPNPNVPIQPFRETPTSRVGLGKEGLSEVKQPLARKEFVYKRIQDKKKMRDLLESKGDPKAFITIVTKAAQRGIIIPGILIFTIPVLVGIFLGPGGAVALIIGTLLSGFALAIFMANAGGALDNAKKKIEEEGGSGTQEHFAAVIGDTVGDPLKDTAGPSMNILIKLISVVSIETAVLVVTLYGRLFQ